MNTVNVQLSQPDNVINLPQDGTPTAWAKAITEHSDLVRDYRRVSELRKRVTKISRKLLRLADTKLAEMQFRKLPAETKARLALWHSLGKHEGNRPTVKQLLKRELMYLQRARLSRRKKLDGLETHILGTQPQGPDDYAILIEFVATLLREGRPLEKRHVAKILDGLATNLHNSGTANDAGHQPPLPGDPFKQPA